MSQKQKANLYELRGGIEKRLNELSDTRTAVVELLKNAGFILVLPSLPLEFLSSFCLHMLDLKLPRAFTLILVPHVRAKSGLPYSPLVS